MFLGSSLLPTSTPRQSQPPLGALFLGTTYSAPSCVCNRRKPGSLATGLAQPGGPLPSGIPPPAHSPLTPELHPHTTTPLPNVNVVRTPPQPPLSSEVSLGPLPLGPTTYSLPKSCPTVASFPPSGLLRYLQVSDHLRLSLCLPSPSPYTHPSIRPSVHPTILS